MATYKELQDAIKKLSGFDDLQFESAMCNVKNVDITNNTCTCTPVDGSADFLDVYLSMDKSKGFLLIPKTGSLVIVSQISDTVAFISMVSNVDQIYLHGDSQEGLVTVKSLTTKLNNLENKVNDLIIACSSQIVTLAPTGTFPLAPYFTSVLPLSITTKSEIQNTKVKHGDI
jgi:hypothetical protein